MATCDATPLQSILKTHHDVEYVLAKQPRLFWRGSDEPQVGRWVFSCSSFSKFSNSIFFQKAVVFLVHEKGESERERASNFFLFLFVPQSRWSLKISWRSFFRSITVSFTKCASDERSVKILILRGGNWGWVSVVCHLGHSGVRSRDRQLGFVTTVSPNCLVSNHWVFWVVY